GVLHGEHGDNVVAGAGGRGHDDQRLTQLRDRLVVVGDEDDVADDVPGQDVAAGELLEAILGPPIARLEVAHEAHTLEDVVADGPRLPEPVDVEKDEADCHLVWDPDVAPGEDANKEDREAAGHDLEDAPE